MNHRGSELQVECGDTLCFSNHVDLDNPAVLKNEVDDHARLTSWREHEAGVAVHQTKLRCSPAPSIGCVPSRKDHKQAWIAGDEPENEVKAGLAEAAE
jgi:hypothetical protein